MHNPLNLGLIVCVLAVAWLILSAYTTQYSRIYDKYTQVQTEGLNPEWCTEGYGIPHRYGNQGS
jgi:hypothetical protein